ncbi:PEP-CTERM sorting domain-containing protein [Chamaesiphon sp. GL140_3_metabinner_50]|uniref:PEP-CTERM sorting domain-containing protein n=1 Tax=Chamaesiphon sp. GL140_3_metabinner_50 TaxID=2970812 RepID=UPI0025F8E4FB|nr:PEP-CTERM sorting domain-containing protein [Chamaesiphon sp. GL140_3_metabinner_50]
MKMTTRSLINGVAVGGLSTIALSFGSVGQAQAATISTLFSTGFNSAGTLGAGNDANYTLTGSSFGAAPRAIAIGTFPATVYNSVPAGQGDDNKSAWIGPNNDGLQDIAGTYTYSTSFNLSGLVASTASIQGKWNTDNSGLKLILNGVDVAATNSGFGTGFSTFSLTSGFNSGNNTLAFVVNNAPNGDPINPTALRVEFTSATADLQPTGTEVPEPSDLAGTAFAFGSVVLLKRKFGKKQSISK